LLHKNLERNGSIDKADEDLAFTVWIVEKEFNVGPVNDDFPLLKLLNLVDKEHLRRYEMMIKSGSGTSSKVETFGGR